MPHWPALTKEAKDERITDVMRMRFDEGMTRTAIGVVLGLKGQSVVRWERQGLRRLGIDWYRDLGGHYVLKQSRALRAEVLAVTLGTGRIVKEPRKAGTKRGKK